ncbi:hypothetical protein BC830DRAFT_1160963 [Chytriomyces sp. MP71]|nr:hypothetical protein BC830DRAFT_1160963 [Chytriomyces sp. MP71]
MWDAFKRSMVRNPDKLAFGQRSVVQIVEEKKQVTRTLHTGEIVLEAKLWKYFELSPYDWMTWGQVQSITRAYASGYRALGLKSGDKVTIYAETSRDWMLQMIAVVQQSFVITTAYPTLGEDGLTYRFGTKEAIFGQPLPMIVKVASAVKTLKNIVYNGNVDVVELNKLLQEHKHMKILSLEELQELGEQNLVEPVPPRDSVILTHLNLVANLSGNFHHYNKVISSEGADERYLAFLPMSHILELSVEMLVMYLGVPIGYGSPKTLMDAAVRNCKGDLRELRPTLLTGVPALWNAIRKSVEEQVASASTVSRALFSAAFSLKHTCLSAGFDSLATPLDVVVFSKVQEQLGGRLRLALNAGAPVPHSTQEFLNITVARTINGYGMTETTAGICMQAKSLSLTSGSIGAPCTNAEVKLVDVPDTEYKASNQPNPQGELWVRGPAVMKGYFQQDALTKETITADGWLKSGDICEYNSKDGTFRVIDRTKNLVKLSNGEYIALEKLEANYKVSKYVQNMMLHADSEKSFAVGIIQPIRAAVLDDLKAVGKTMAFKPAEIVGQIWLGHEEWTPQNGLLTAAMKLNRKAILAHFTSQVNEMYSDLK